MQARRTTCERICGNQNQCSRLLSSVHHCRAGPKLLQHVQHRFSAAYGSMSIIHKARASASIRQEVRALPKETSVVLTVHLEGWASPSWDPGVRLIRCQVIGGLRQVGRQVIQDVSRTWIKTAAEKYKAFGSWQCNVAGRFVMHHIAPGRGDNNARELSQGLLDRCALREDLG